MYHLFNCTFSKCQYLRIRTTGKTTLHCFQGESRRSERLTESVTASVFGSEC